MTFEGLDAVRAVAGDMEARRRLASVDSEVVRAWQQATRTALIVDLKTALRVAEELLARTITEEEAHAWAVLVFEGSFVEQATRIPARRAFDENGAVIQADVPLPRPGRTEVELVVSGPVVLDVDYADENDDLIAETVRRLQELGDAIDGTLSDLELRQLIAKMRAVSAGT